MRVRWVEHVAFKGGNKTHKMFGWGTPEGKSPLKNPRRRWKGNITTDFKETEG